MYHFIGIKGAGMSALAVIMKQLGYEVQGSDLEKHFFTEKELIKNNINFFTYNENNITNNLTIIRGLSITEEHPELKKARELNLEVIDYNQMVGILTKKFKTICICGCHGKTTTTAMTSHVLNQIKGINYLIGDGTGYANKENKYFALESCEYKRHFLAYSPYYTVILNIDLDHVDYFKDIFDVIDAYQEFANSSAKMIIANGDDDNIRKMNVEKEISYFGLNENNNIRAINIKYTKEGTTFDVLVDNKLYGHFALPIYGLHQLMDALAVISVCYFEDIPSEEVSTCFQTFTGAKRRFTETFVGNNVIIDDYAHHPNEIKSTINAIKQKYPDKLIVSIFQPHTFSRTKEFAKDIANELSKTDISYIMDIHPARETQEDYKDITNYTIINEMKNAYPLNMDDANILNKHKDAVFIFMSPNDLSKLEQELINLKELEKLN
ncbi:MAG: UDP-N-acetylmuramate--L-alanine ligase [Bacilli bacterium]|nr:UDP-N-acetylmuramate--L-alanine ligase [Bacilli bacterium]